VVEDGKKHDRVHLHQLGGISVEKKRIHITKPRAATQKKSG
jgi:hypothetical protein